MTLAPPVPGAGLRARRCVHVPPLWLAAAGGWLALALMTVGGAQSSAGGHHHDAAAGAPPGLHAAAWLAMVATMLPLITPNVRFAAARSPVRARGEVTVAVVAGWALVWSGATVALVTLLRVVEGLLGATLTVVAATVVAAVWQRAPLKLRSVARCSRRLAPPLDRRRRRRATWRYGLALGRDCVVSCVPLMALATAARHSLPVAGLCVGVAWYERRRRPHHDPATRMTSALILAGGATTATLAVLS